MRKLFKMYNSMISSASRFTITPQQNDIEDTFNLLIQECKSCMPESRLSSTLKEKLER